MKIIESYSGEDILVDDDDYEFLINYNWRYHLGGNTSRKFVHCTDHKTNKQLIMRRIIMKCPPNKFVVHLDENTLNHQRYNLKILTVSEFRRTCPPREGRQYKGFSRNGNVKRPYTAAITINKKSVFIGDSKSEIRAAQLYDAAVNYLKFEHCYRNFPEEDFDLPISAKTRLDKLCVR